LTGRPLPWLELPRLEGWRPTRRAVALVIALGVIALIGIALGHAVTGPFSGLVSRDIDAPTRRWVEPNTPVWHRRFAHLSAFGTAGITAAVALAAGVAFSAARRSFVPLMRSAAAFAGAGALTVVVKFGVNRQPASGPLPSFSAGTFPSGHALFAVAVYGTVAVLIMRTRAPWLVRIPLGIFIAAATLLIGWSRVYLLDHYLSDVLGSLVLGVAWVAAIAVFIGPDTNWQRPRK
jgi:membrane-associated phospholipid phosphatase